MNRKENNFDWASSIEKILGVLINCSLVPEAQVFLAKAGTFELIEEILKNTIYSESQNTLITRLMYLLSRLVSQPEVVMKIVSSKIMLVSLFLYFNRQFPDLTPHILKILFTLFKLKDKLSEFTTEYGINISIFVNESKEMLTS